MDIATSVFAWTLIVLVLALLVGCLAWATKAVWGMVL